MPGPLDGIKVLDLTRVLAGPYATMLLGDLGAEVIKIEQPDTGDESRNFGPFKNGFSLYFMSVNRGKRSVTLNLKTERGQAIFKQLLAHTDIVVENFRPGTMEKLGLDYNTLKPEHPSLIYAACSGFGQTGPYAQQGAYDMIIQGMGGIISITGEPDGPPVRVGTSISDITAALFTTIGVLSALHHRNQTGKGQFVDVAMLDSLVAVLENAVVRYFATGEAPKPLGARHPRLHRLKRSPPRMDTLSSHSETILSGQSSVSTSIGWISSRINASEQMLIGRKITRNCFLPFQVLCPNGQPMTGSMHSEK